MGRIEIISLGLDLAGKENKQSGFGLISFGELVDYGLLFSNKQIMSYIERVNPDIVAIDAPFNMPKKGNLRDCDKTMKQIGLSPLPPTLPGMRILVERARILVKWLNDRGIKAIEVFPAGALRFLGYEKKPRNNAQRVKIIRDIIKSIGLKSKRNIYKLSPDAFDGIICAITGLAFLTDNYVEIRGEECSVIFPVESSKWK